MPLTQPAGPVGADRGWSRKPGWEGLRRSGWGLELWARDGTACGMRLFVP
jgi:hypothetical protein